LSNASAVAARPIRNTPSVPAATAVPAMPLVFWVTISGTFGSGCPIGAHYLPLPAGAMELTAFTRWAKKLDRWLARTQRVELTSKQEPPETVTLGPKRGGVSVELVAIVWELG
jgi:hypothetical protein